MAVNFVLWVQMTALVAERVAARVAELAAEREAELAAAEDAAEEPAEVASEDAKLEAEMEALLLDRMQCSCEGIYFWFRVRNRQDLGPRVMVSRRSYCLGQ